jgi:hypothetical protein
MTTTIQPPSPAQVEAYCYYHIEDNVRLKKIIMDAEQQVKEEAVILSKPGLRRVAINPGDDPSSGSSLAMAFRFAVDILPGATFPSTIVSCGWHGPLGFYVVCARRGHFELFDLHQGRRPQLHLRLPVTIADAGQQGAVDACLDRSGRLFVLSEDGEICCTGPISGLPSYSSSSFANSSSYLATSTRTLAPSLASHGDGTLRPTWCPIEPAPSDLGGRRPLRLLTLGDKFLLLAFKEGRLDLMLPVHFDDDSPSDRPCKLLLVDVVSTDQSIEDVVPLLKDDAPVADSLVILHGDGTHTVVSVDSTDARLYMGPPSSVPLSRMPLQSAISPVLRIDVDEAQGTTMDLVYAAESLQALLLERKADRMALGPEALRRSDMLPVTVQKAAAVGDWIGEHLEGPMRRLTDLLHGMQSKCRQLLLLARILRRTVPPATLPFDADRSSSADRTAELTARMAALRTRVERLKSLQCQGLRHWTKQVHILPTANAGNGHASVESVIQHRTRMLLSKQ